MQLRVTDNIYLLEQLGCVDSETNEKMQFAFLNVIIAELRVQRSLNFSPRLLLIVNSYFFVQKENG